MVAHLLANDTRVLVLKFKGLTEQWVEGLDDSLLKASEDADEISRDPGNPLIGVVKPSCALADVDRLPDLN